MSKQFDAVQYAADDPAKHTVIAWLRSNRIDACVNPDQFGIDILASRNSNKFEIEVEVKHNWKGKHYPFDTVHISSRKEKFAHEKSGVFVWFCLVNHERTHAVFVPGVEFLAAPIVVKNTTCTKGESFREIKTGTVYRITQDAKHERTIKPR